LSKDFNISFVSPYNEFASYQFTFSYPGGSYSDSGSTPGGEYFGIPFSISSDGWVYLSYTFFLTDGSTSSNSYAFRISTPWMDKTLVNMGDGDDYGMLFGDKIFWLIIILLIVMGSAFLGIGFEGALIFGGFILLLMTTNGFIPLDKTPLLWIVGFGIVFMLFLRAWGNK
jgi:hypothetical protein